MQLSAKAGWPAHACVCVCCVCVLCSACDWQVSIENSNYDGRKLHFFRLKSVEDGAQRMRWRQADCERHAERLQDTAVFIWK